jgi:calcineurin-like phosphoesterase family protein
MKIKLKNTDSIFFTSDLHFFHYNIINYCNRPFENLYQMHNTLIENWNKVVPKNGYVFIAGDFAMTANIGSISKILNKLNGSKILIYGNHDYQNRFDREVISSMFKLATDYVELTVMDESNKVDTQFAISHYPFMYWRRGYYHLHGHVHSGPNSESSEQVPFHKMRYDVGVDNNDFTPITYSELIGKFKKYNL